MTTSNYPTIAAVLYELDQLMDENESLRIRIQELESRGGQQQDNRKKLTKREVKEVRQLHRAGESQRAIADVFDVHPSSICRIINGQYHGRVA